MVQTNDEIMSEINQLIDYNYNKCCKTSIFKYLLPLLLLFLVLLFILYLISENSKSSVFLEGNRKNPLTPTRSPVSTPEPSSRPNSRSRRPTFNISNNSNNPNNNVITNIDRYVTTTNIAAPIRYNNESNDTKNTLKTDDISSTLAENGSVKSQNISSNKSQNISSNKSQNISSNKSQNIISKSQNISSNKSQNIISNISQNIQKNIDTNNKNISSENKFLSQFTNNLLTNKENSENYFSNIFKRNTNIFKDLDLSNSKNIPNIIKSLIPIKNFNEKNKSFCYYNYDSEEDTCYLKK